MRWQRLHTSRHRLPLLLKHLWQRPAVQHIPAQHSLAKCSSTRSRRLPTAARQLRVREMSRRRLKRQRRR
jgi:hypothetical protein